TRGAGVALMQVRRFHPGQITGGSLLCAAAMASVGCDEEITYNPGNDAAVPDAAAPAAASQPEALPPDAELNSTEIDAQPEESETTAADDPPSDRYARADAAREMAAPPSGPSIESGLFSDDTYEPEAAPTPEAA